MKPLAVLFVLSSLITLTTDETPESLASPAEFTLPGITAIAETRRENVVTGLAPLSFLVGEWKGVAQLRRSSNTGAWSEQATGVWHFDQRIPCLLIQLKPGNKAAKLLFTAESQTGRPIMELQHDGHEPIALQMAESSIPGGITESSGSRTASGDAQQDHWVFESIARTDQPEIRLTFRKINDIRMTLLFEERPNADATYRRQYELGMTREGNRLASGNTGERQCVVTGGLGTMAVMHDGKTFYVCCEGCKQAFEADPEGTIAAYRQRLKSD